MTTQQFNPFSRRHFLGRSARLMGGAALLGAVPILTSCGDDDGSSDTSAAGTTSPPGTTAAPGTSAATTAAPTTGGATTTAASATSAAETTAGSTPAVTGKLTTVFSWVPDIEWAAWYLAESKGFFANHGVESTLLHGGPNTPAVVQVIAAGDGNIGLSGDELEILHANATGADYVAVAAMYQRSPFGYCWLPESGIKTAADLVGKRIGAPQGDQIRIDAIFKINGLPADYEFIPMSFDPQPLADKEMDVITCYVTNQPIQLQAKGVATESAPFSDFGLPSYGDVIFVSKAFLDANRDLVVNYLAALLQGVDANIADPMEVVPILVSEYGADNEIDEDYAKAGNPAYIALMPSDFTEANGLLSMDPEYLETKVWPGLEAAGETNLPDVATFLDPTVLADAHKLK
jgi:ABC-type nitrate/sulfonate/bicarbonate transport system substrate-binding protein